jgi:isocitrate/isopropylmalate dehydrogenase
MILAGAALLSYFGSPEADRASRAIYEAVFEAIFDGVKTADLGAHATTTEFTDDVIRRVKSKLEVWSALG